MFVNIVEKIFIFVIFAVDTVVKDCWPGNYHYGKKKKMKPLLGYHVCFSSTNQHIWQINQTTIRVTVKSYKKGM